MVILTKSKQKEISENLLKNIYLFHTQIEGLNEDLEFEFGPDLLNRRIGETKNDEKFYLTLRDQFGSIIERLIDQGLELVRELGLDEKDFRDNLDLILDNPKIYDGKFNYWMGYYPSKESMKLETGTKRWWSRNNKK